ncbi:MAG: protein-L-isoaspartate O-methyltransferase [Gluconacetobacter diazotrophicus]|nr:protein-L-isoaspartate O-methyltransferase [Gluconacetobacter diazotrophicus]
MSLSADLPAADRNDRSFARRRMVDTQVRPVGVSDPRLLEAMRDLPRERFVPPDRGEIAYMDDDVPLGNGRVLMEPRIAGRLLQCLAPRRGETALVIGAGTGYSACLLGRLGLIVTALEQDPALLAAGRELGGQLQPGLSWREAPFAAGLADAAPFDIILIDGAVRAAPHALAVQLSATGRLGGVLMQAARVGRAFVAEAAPGGLAIRPQFDATTAILPGFDAPDVFRF